MIHRSIHSKGNFKANRTSIRSARTTQGGRKKGLVRNSKASSNPPVPKAKDSKTFPKVLLGILLGSIGTGAFFEFFLTPDNNCRIVEKTQDFNSTRSLLLGQLRILQELIETESSFPNALKLRNVTSSLLEKFEEYPTLESMGSIENFAGASNRMATQYNINDLHFRIARILTDQTKIIPKKFRDKFLRDLQGLCKPTLLVRDPAPGTIFKKISIEELELQFILETLESF